jgi:hypothetical protein
MRTQVTSLALALVGIACRGESTESTEPTFSSNVLISVAGDPEMKGQPEGFDGVWIELCPDVVYRSTFALPHDEETATDDLVNGHPFDFVSGWLTIGPKRYGAIANGERVRISGEGVFVEGKPLGPLPEPVAEPGDGD